MEVETNIYYQIKKTFPKSYDLFIKKYKHYLKKHKNFQAYSFMTQFGRFYDFLQDECSKRNIEFYLYLSHERPISGYKKYILQIFKDLEKDIDSEIK